MQDLDIAGKTKLDNFNIYCKKYASLTLNEYLR